MTDGGGNVETKKIMIVGECIWYQDDVDNPDDDYIVDYAMYVSSFIRIYT